MQTESNRALSSVRHDSGICRVSRLESAGEAREFLVWPGAGENSGGYENHERLSGNGDSVFGELRRRQREMLKLSDDRRPTSRRGTGAELLHPGVTGLKLAMIGGVADDRGGYIVRRG